MRWLGCVTRGCQPSRTRAVCSRQRGNKCKGPEAGGNLESWRNREKASVVKHTSQGREEGDVLGRQGPCHHGGFSGHRDGAGLFPIIFSLGDTLPTL